MKRRCSRPAFAACAVAVSTLAICCYLFVVPHGPRATYLHAVSLPQVLRTLHGQCMGRVHMPGSLPSSLLQRSHLAAKFDRFHRWRLRLQGAAPPSSWQLLRPQRRQPQPQQLQSALDEPWQADFAFVVVTGALTAQRRVPLQQLTLFKRSIRNYILIGAGADPGFLRATPGIVCMQKRCKHRRFSCECHPTKKRPSCQRLLPL